MTTALASSSTPQVDGSVAAGAMQCSGKQPGRSGRAPSNKDSGAVPASASTKATRATPRDLAVPRQDGPSAERKAPPARRSARARATKFAHGAANQTPLLALDGGEFVHAAASAALNPSRAAVTWPALEQLRLDEAALAQRSASIGGSDANVILSGSAERIVRLWREKRGQVEPEDLSGHLNVMLGCWTEAFNRQWYEKLTGEQVTRSGERCACPVRPWRTATLDGVVAGRGAVWEAKHTSAFARPEEVLARYMPQLQHAMAVTGCGTGLLSVIYGNHKWEVYEVASDWMYQEDLLEAEQRFWHCVTIGEPPAIVHVDRVPRPVGVREVAMHTSNAWAAAAADWLANREAARLHAGAATTLRELVEDDVARAFGHGIEAKRSKAGAITIRELAA